MLRKLKQNFIIYQKRKRIRLFKKMKIKRSVSFKTLKRKKDNGPKKCFWMAQIKK